MHEPLKPVSDEGAGVPDPELMARLAAGEDQALNQLMDRWSKRVIAFLFRMTGNRDRAVELAQETFVKLYQARGRYRPGGKFSTWLFAIAANLARNELRWRARHPTVPLESEEAGAGPAAERTPDEQAAARERIAAVHQAILALPPDLRQALTLFTYEGMSYAEIAKLSRCSAKAVETRIYRARRTLKDQLGHLS
ncbi:MAG: RNA polymerase sigma factor [Verrucomicrobiales bacterium]|nr:sigma-70 family RNA polymerase sigma factor [Verrucomicrobiota bacterium JB025]